MESDCSPTLWTDSRCSSSESLSTLTTTCDNDEDYVEESGSCCNVDTEIVVIGNGPAGLSLSAFLSGWKPYYNLNSPHSDAQIHSKLSQHASVSLVDQDLTWFEEEFAEIINPSVRPVSHLIDMLMRPANCLRFVYNPESAVPHVVLGETEIGGSWTEYDDEMITVSLANWLDLPGFTIEEWLQGQPLVARLPAGVVREYMKAYVQQMHLTDKIRTRTRATMVTKHHDVMNNNETFYTVSGEDSKGHEFSVKCHKVVLACGQSRQKHLQVDGEYMEPNIVYDVAGLKRMLHIEEGQPKNGRIIVVGDGISAADAINLCLRNELSVLHVMRRSEAQIRQTMLSKLSPSIYPEYSKMYKLMTGKTTDKFYSKVTSASVIKMDNRIATIETQGVTIREQFYIIAACIGRRSELSMFPEKIDFNSDYRCDSDPHIFGVGSLAGDHFIRYLVGGSLQVAATLISEYSVNLKQRQFQLVQNQMAEQLRQMEQKQKRLRRKPAPGRCCWISRILSTTS